jgi:hypothetical protein
MKLIHNKFCYLSVIWQAKDSVVGTYQQAKDTMAGEADRVS